MSGGGFYKYRCKYFLIYDCTNWVWINGVPCSYCMALGRDNDGPVMSALQDCCSLQRSSVTRQFEPAKRRQPGSRILSPVVPDRANLLLMESLWPDHDTDE